MEALLLSGSDKTQLKFTFALRFARLQPACLRREAYGFARSLYDLRSEVAHGSDLGVEVKLNRRLIRRSLASQYATEALRWLIQYFFAALPHSWTEEDWQRLSLLDPLPACDRAADGWLPRSVPGPTGRQRRRRVRTSRAEHHT